jgi:hypothetical protein
MDHLVLSVHEGFDRLQRRLLAMQIGDAICATDAADETGLSVEVCGAVLAGLERAGLMAQKGSGQFVRRRLVELQRS